ncbi:unnamed protein product [Ranitomeya imitator]|uniref:Reverse transcriptase n=1 Tax=Ranitomeya imitator TaxID=111125 RepID=A0ABN9L1Q0_9NEOB|nr:unnamed protein product [Ranitomeya imitator]
MRKARDHNAIDFNGSDVLLLSDFSRFTLAKRKALRPLLEVLRENKIPYSWGARLVALCSITSPLGNSDSKSKGVSTALHKSLQAQVVASKADSNGRYVFLKLKIAHDLFTIANIYLPNQDQVRACRKYLWDLLAFVEGYVIMGGDFNMVLDRAVDSSSGRSAVSLSQLERLPWALTDSRFCILYIRSMSRADSQDEKHHVLVFFLDQHSSHLAQHVLIFFLDQHSSHLAQHVLVFFLDQHSSHLAQHYMGIPALLAGSP